MPIAIGVHTFAGSFVRGAEKAGWDVPYTLETSTFGMETARYNNPRTRFVSSVSGWRDALREYNGAIEYVFANPACSCWSPLGRSTSRGKQSWRTDPNFEQSAQAVAVGLLARPHVWVTESVPAFERYGAATAIANLWINAGYGVTLIRHDAKFFGLPQQRRRVMLVAHRGDFPVRFPKFDGIMPVGAAIENVAYGPDDYEPIYPELEPIIAMTKPGEHVKNHLPADWTGRRPRFVDHRIPYDHLSGTITGNDIYYHPRENRHLAWQEYAALCGYPPDWRVFADRPGRALQHLAKAVLPPIAQWISGQVYNSLEHPNARAFSYRATLVQHWASSQRLRDLDVVHREEPWTWEADDEAVDIVTERVNAAMNAIINA